MEEIKRDLLEKVEREYYEIKEDFYVEFKPQNAINFLNAFIQEVIYKYMKKDFYSNPRVIYTRWGFHENNTISKNYRDTIGKYTMAFYTKPSNLINISALRIIQVAYNNSKDLLGLTTKDIKDNEDIQNDMKQIIEIYLIDTILHEFVHSVEYNEFKINNISKSEVEKENDYDHIIYIFMKYSFIINEYIGFDFTKKLPYTYYYFMKTVPNLYKDNKNKDKDLFQLFMENEVYTHRKSKRRFRKCSMIRHLFYHIIQSNIPDKEIRTIEKKVFHERYDLNITIVENQNALNDYTLLLTFNKEILTNPELYMCKIETVAAEVMLYKRRYSVFNYVIQIKMYEETKEIYVLYGIDLENLYSTIQFKKFNK